MGYEHYGMIQKPVPVQIGDDDPFLCRGFHILNKLNPTLIIKMVGKQAADDHIHRFNQVRFVNNVGLRKVNIAIIWGLLPGIVNRCRRSVNTV